MPRHWIGTSGWSYDNWKGLFYPRGVSGARRLPYYAERYASVELNASFYRLPSATMIAGWVERTPADFLFALKAWQQITHRKRLADSDEPLAAFLACAAAFGGKCGPVLFQLPPKFPPDVGRIEAFLARLPKDKRFAFEFRDRSWHVEAVYERLRARNAAFVPFELTGLDAPRIVTADFVYVRLHGREARYRGDYGEATLREWADWFKARMAEGRDVFCYFDNTDEADHALANARRLDELLRA